MLQAHRLSCPKAPGERTVSCGLMPIPGSSCSGAARSASECHPWLFKNSAFDLLLRRWTQEDPIVMREGAQFYPYLLWIWGRWCRGGVNRCPAQHSSYPQQRLERLGNVQQSKLERRCRACRAAPRNHVQDWFFIKYPNCFKQCFLQW